MMKKDLNYYLNLPYTITIKRLDDGDYFAQYADMGLTKNNLRPAGELPKPKR